MKKFSESIVQSLQIEKRLIMVAKMIALSLLFAQVTYAQVKITGKVTDSKGETLPGVNILEKGTNNGTITDMDGVYTIDVSNSESILFYSMVGMIAQEVIVGNQTAINITLIEDDKQLDEVVVIGYGTVKKSDLTGAVGMVKSDDLTKITTSTVATALQGKVSGLTITPNSGAPGAQTDIKIRGVGSFGGNKPLILIDGIKSTVDYLNPNDIESVEVLKDAGVAAIYGTEAGNGVVLITTKKGKVGKTIVSFSASSTIYEEAINRYDMLNASEYMTVNRLANENGIASGTASGLHPWHTSSYSIPFGNTDWQDEVYKSGLTQNYNISMRGGSKDFSYLFSTGYYDQEGTMIGTEYNKFNIRFNGELRKGKFKLNPNVAYMQNFNRKGYFSNTNKITEVRKLPPIVPVFDASRPNGYGYNTVAENVVGKANLLTNNKKHHELMTNLNMEFEIIEGLKINLNSGLRNYSTNELKHEPAHQVSIEEVQFTSIDENNYHSIRTTVEPYMSYQKDFGKHGVNVMFGTSYEKFTTRNADIGVKGFVLDENDIAVPAGWDVDPNIKTLYASKGGTPTVDGSEFTSTKFSYFGRINYSFDSKYVIQAIVRKDYSSRFGKDKAAGLFPSFSAAWNISNESFFESLSSVFSNLRLRASYGKTGTESGLAFYDYLALMQSSWWGYPLGTSQIMNPTKYASSLENRGIHWEETESVNIGLDFGLLNSKIDGSINYYNNKRKDMLLERKVAPSAGVNDPWVNDASMKNSGFELELSYRDKLGDLNYNISGTFTTVKNEVTDIAGLDLAEKWGDQIDFGLPANKTVVGYPVGSFFLFQYDGVFQSQAEIDAYNANGVDEDGNPSPLLPNAEPGDARFLDANGDGMLNDDDRIYSGSAIPKYEYSFNIGLDYKGLDFTMQFYGVGGNKIYNVPRYHAEKMSDNFNQSKTTLNAWTVDNPSTTMPRPVFGDPNKNARTSTRFLEKGNYLKLSYVQLGYTLPEALIQKVGIQKGRIYVSGQNLYTFTKYKGIDPEVIERADVYSTGLEYGSHPLSRTILFGIQLDF